VIIPVTPSSREQLLFPLRNSDVPAQSAVLVAAAGWAMIVASKGGGGRRGGLQKDFSNDIFLQLLQSRGKISTSMSTKEVVRRKERRQRRA